MTALPAGAYGVLTGTIATPTPNLANPTSAPELIPAVGRLVFTPSIPRAAVRADGQDVMLSLVPTEVSLDDSGSFSVSLLGTSGELVSPDGWRYRVTFHLESGISLAAFDFQVEGGQTVDLATIQTFEVSKGVVIARGPKGDPGEPGISSADFTAQLAADRTRQDADYAPAARKGPIRLLREQLSGSTAVRPAGDTLVDQWGLLYGTDGFTADKALSPMPDSLVVPPGAGRTGTSNDVPMLLDLAAQAKETGMGLRFRSGSYYNVRSALRFPTGVPLLGGFVQNTIFYCNAAGYVQFGNLDSSGPAAGVGADVVPMIQGFTIHGTNQAISPLRIGYVVNTKFRDIRVTRAAKGPNPLVPRPAMLVASAQNCEFQGVEVSGNGDDGIMFDWGPANITFIDCIIRDNGRVGTRFTRTGPPPANTSVIEYPRNIRFFGGLNENNLEGQVLLETGQQVEWISSQISGDAGSGIPSIVMSDRLAAVGVAPMGGIVYNGGQLKAGNFDGVAARVMRSELQLTGGVNLRGADYALEVGPSGLITLGMHRQENNNHLVRAIGSVDSAGAAVLTGAPALRNVFRRSAEAPQISYPVTSATPFALPASSTTTVPVPNPPALDKEAEYEFEVEVVANDASGGSADMREAFTLPAGATMEWTSDALSTGATTAQTGVWREALNESSIKTGVGLITTDTLHTIRGRITTGANAGTLQFRAAQSASNAAVVTITRLRIKLLRLV